MNALLLAALLAVPLRAADRTLKTAALPALPVASVRAPMVSLPAAILPPSALPGLLPSAAAPQAAPVPLPARLAETAKGVTAAMAGLEKGPAPGAESSRGAGDQVQRLLMGEKPVAASAVDASAAGAPRDDAGASLAAAAGPELAKRVDDLGAARGLRVKTMTAAQFLALARDAAAQADAEPGASPAAKQVRAALLRVVEALAPADKPMSESAGRLFSVWQVFGQESARVAADTGSPAAVAADAALFAAQVEASVPGAEKKEPPAPEVTPADPEGYGKMAQEGSVFGWQPIASSPGHGFAPLDALIRRVLSEKKASPYAAGFQLPGAGRREDALIHFYGERHTDGGLIRANMARLVEDARPGRPVIVLVEGYTGRDLLGYEALAYLEKRGLDAAALKAKGAREVTVSSWEGAENYEASQRPLMRHHMDLLELNRLAHSQLRGWRYYSAVARAGWTALLGRLELWKIAIVARNRDLDAAVAQAAAAAEKTGATLHVIAGTDHLVQRPRLGAALPRLFKPSFRRSLKAAAGGRPFWASQPANTPPGPTPKALRLLIMGPPASGKGTYAVRLARDYGVVHVSAGDLLREHAKTHPEIAETMKRGDLVPTSLVVGLVRDRLKQEDVRKRGFVLDGFPRRLQEAQELRGMMKAERLSFDAAIRLEIPEAELLRRILARGRADDTEPTFRNRMKIYRSESVPAMEHVSRGVPVVKPPLVEGGPDANYVQLKKRLDRATSPGPLRAAWRALLRALFGR